MTPASFTKDELWTALREASENLQAMRDFVDAQPHDPNCFMLLTSNPEKQITGCTCWKSRSPHFVRPVYNSNLDNLTRRVADAGRQDWIEMFHAEMEARKMTAPYKPLETTEELHGEFIRLKTLAKQDIEDLNTGR